MATDNNVKELQGGKVGVKGVTAKFKIYDSTTGESSTIYAKLDNNAGLAMLKGILNSRYGQSSCYQVDTNDIVVGEEKDQKTIKMLENFKYNPKGGGGPNPLKIELTGVNLHLESGEKTNVKIEKFKESQDSNMLVCRNLGIDGTKCFLNMIVEIATQHQKEVSKLFNKINPDGGKFTSEQKEIFKKGIEEINEKAGKIVIDVKEILTNDGNSFLTINNAKCIETSTPEAPTQEAPAQEAPAPETKKRGRPKKTDPSR